MEYGSELFTMVLTFLQAVCEDEVVILRGKENSLGSALSVINILLPSWINSIRLIDEGMYKCRLKPNWYFYKIKERSSFVDVCVWMHACVCYKLHVSHTVQPTHPDTVPQHSILYSCYSTILDRLTI